MAKLELGSKHQCQNCGAKFFDLNKDPIVCPKCGTVFQGVSARARPAAKAEEEEDTELVTPAGVDVVSLDEVEAGEEKAAAEPAVDDIDVEEDAEDDAADDPFLEEEEEDDDDVSNLIDGDIAPDEET
ncbi:MAG: TIGR02300 family protein [Roseiarcus sp.]